MNKLLYRILRYSWLPVLFRELIQKNKVTILLFHNISKETAERTFLYLSKKYNIIALNDFINAKKNQTELPEKAMILTFDDGYIQNYEMLAVVKKLNIPVTIFLCASIVNTNRHFWFRYNNTSILKNQLKLKSNVERLETLSKFGFMQDKEYATPQALQKEHIDEMKDFINMQSHTMFHPILPKCNDEIARAEIFNSKEILEKEFNLEINTISYPNGDYSDRDILFAKEANYECGITLDYGFNTIKSDMFRLKRLCVNDTDDINELITKASGVWAFLRTGNGYKQEFGFTEEIKN